MIAILMSLALSLTTLTTEQRAQFVESLTPEEALVLQYHWPFWARPEQLHPAGDWATWLVMAGRGFGKTRVGAEETHQWAQELGAEGRVALVGKDPTDVRKTMIEGESGLLACAPPWFRPVYEPALTTLTWPNGCRAFAYSSEVPDKLRGPQHHKFWGDELCFVAGTLIETPDGPRAIESLIAGDEVTTRSGARRVVASTCTGIRPIWELTTTANRRLVGTENHPVFVDESRTLQLSRLIDGGTIIVWPPKSSSGAESAGTSTAITSATDTGSSCTARCTRTRLGRSIRRSMSIIATSIDAITSSPTSSRSRVESTSAFTSRTGSRRGSQISEAPTQAPRSGDADSLSLGNVPSAAANSNRPGCAASSVAPPAAPLSTVATDRVRSVRQLGLYAPVFNLQVEQDAEYFANGILVHNCKWKHAQDTWDNLQFGLRLGDNPQGIITTTPRPIATLKEILADPASIVTRGSTFDNRANLPKRFLDRLLRLYAGTRLGRQELNAELLTETPGALWTLKGIEACRVRKAPHLIRIGIAIDPAAGSPKTAEDSEGHAETGIVAGGVDRAGVPHILQDASGRYTPGEWGKRAVELYQELQADFIVGEANNGGEMVAHVVKTAARDLKTHVNVKLVHASRGKQTRAEPVSALYEQKRAAHVGAFPELEDQMSTWVPGQKSPDRMDALVWLVTKLVIDAAADMPDGVLDVGADSGTSDADTLGVKRQL